MLCIQLFDFTNSTSKNFDVYRLIIHQFVTLRINASLVYKYVCVTTQSRNRCTHVLIYLEYLPHERKILKLGARSFLRGENHALWACDSEHRRSPLHSLASVLDLE